MTEHLRVERLPQQATAVITLNRPEVMNAISTAMITGLEGALSELATEEAVRTLVVTGAGEKAFCAGMDLKERAVMAPGQIARQRRTLIGVLGYLNRYPKPVIIAANGTAMGGGFEIALAADLIVAAENARFALPECRIGIMPAGGGTHTLTWLVGPNRARDLILTGRAITAGEAYEWGIAARLAPAGQALPAAIALAEQIGQGGPIGLRQAKAAVRKAVRSLAAALVDEDELYQACLDSEDRIEGLVAFGEKRSPRFQGR